MVLIRCGPQSFATIDQSDVETVSKFQWRRHRAHNTFYAQTKLDGHWIYMHSLLTRFVMTDHRDGNGLNNCRDNLRECTNLENLKNTKKRAVSTSRYKGVYWDKNKHRWSAEIMVNRKHLHLGRYYREEDAAHAYAMAAQKFHGEFANTEPRDACT